MAMKPITFDVYLKWYENHDTVVKSETRAMRLLQKGTAVKTLEKQTAVQAEDHSTITTKLCLTPTKRNWNQSKEEKKSTRLGEE